MAKKIKVKPRRRARAARPQVQAQTPIPAPQAQPPAPEWLPLFLLSLYAATFCFSFLLVMPLPLGSMFPQLKEYRIFVTFWALVPALCLALAWLLHQAKIRLFSAQPGFYPALLAANVGVWAKFWHDMPAGVSAEYLADIHTWVPACNVAALCLAYSPLTRNWRHWASLGKLALILAPLSLLLGLRHFDSGALPEVSSWALVGLVAAVATWLTAMKGFRQGSFLGKGLDLAFYVTLALLLFSFNLVESTFHQNIYLGPVNAVLHGKTVLVDENCLYGPGPVYLLALIFKTGWISLYYKQLCFVQMLLWMLQYLGIYWILRKVYASQWLAILAVAFGIVVERYGYYVYGNLAFCSVGPLRFGLPFLVLGSAYLRKAGAKGIFSTRFLELGLMGLACLYSFETFIYCAGGYGAFLAAESWADSQGLGTFLARLAKRALTLALVMALFQVLFALLTYARSGHWPNWGMYLEYIHLYSIGQMSYIPFPPFSPWIFISGLCVISFMASCFVLGARKGAQAETLYAFGITVAAIAEFTYFLGRAHPDNLSHLSMTSVIAGFYWIDFAWNKAGTWKPFRVAATLGAFVVAGAFVNVCWPNAYGEMTMSLLYHVPAGIREFRSGQPSTLMGFLRQMRQIECNEPDVSARAELINKYCPNDSRVAIFVNPQQLTKTLLTARKAHVYPLSTPSLENSMLPSSMSLPMDMKTPLKVGDIIFAAQDDKGAWNWPPEAGLGGGIETAVFDKIKKEFSFQLLESSAGLQVLKLGPLDAESGGK
jgi:hypothetical protein